MVTFHAGFTHIGLHRLDPNIVRIREIGDMFSSLAKSLFGETGSKDIKRLQAQVDAINAAEPTYQSMSDDDLKQMTAILKDRHEAGESLDTLLVDAFAVVREAAVRTLGQRHFDVQLMGGIVLHEGRISEMKTGEGKPLWLTGCLP